jgi:hypothetical protein
LSDRFGDADVVDLRFLILVMVIDDKNLNDLGEK